MFHLNVPATANEIEEFLGRAYEKPLLGIFTSVGKEWSLDRDAIISTAETGVGPCAERPKWFLAIPLIQVNEIKSRADLLADIDRQKDYHGCRDLTLHLEASGRLFVGFIGEEIKSHCYSGAAKVAIAALDEAWAELDDSPRIDRTGDLEEVKSIVDRLSVARIV
ncbi:MAG: hypothetical protein M3Q07_07990 [Pseudobdellovibrionaceae bacterium]|nr:hypothetical protein [Pseudobdellovibrionaceae bacterium]